MREILVSWSNQLGLPGWLIPDYWLMFTFALTAAALLILRLWTKAGYRDARAANLIFWAIPGLFLGARFFYYLQFGFPKDLNEAWARGGLALYGGLFGLLLAWAIYYLIRPYPVLAFLDCVAPGLALGLSIGRVGCFLAGCNGGTVTALPWSVRFPSGTSSYSQQLRDGLIDMDAEFSLPAHPSQLYETFFGAIALLFLIRLFNRRKWEGEVFFSGVLWYSLFRLSTEPLRADLGGVHPFGILTFSQLISLMVGLVSLIGIGWYGRRGAMTAKKHV